MRGARASAAAILVAAALLAAPAVAGAAVTFGIAFATPLTTQTGQLTFRTTVGKVTCTFVFTKTLSPRLVFVSAPPALTHIGEITSGAISNCAGGNIILLNLPKVLFGFPLPGPTSSSWDIHYLSSDPTTGDLAFGILDFQAIVRGALGACLYRGTLLGTLSADGRVLRFDFASLDGDRSCPSLATVTGTLTDSPRIDFTLLSR